MAHTFSEPGAIFRTTFTPRYTPGPAPHVTVPDESAEWVVGIFLEAIPLVGTLVITTYQHDSKPHKYIPLIPN